MKLKDLMNMLMFAKDYEYVEIYEDGTCEEGYYSTDKRLTFEEAVNSELIVKKFDADMEHTSTGEKIFGLMVVIEEEK